MLPLHRATYRLIARQSPPSRDSGATLIEFAVVAPILFLLMFTLADLSLIIIGNTVGGNAAREGARVGIIEFDGADCYPGSPRVSCQAQSTQYRAIEDAVDRLLGGLVRERQPLEVRCLNADTRARIDCSTGTVTLGRDLIEVKVRWRHIGASPFVANQLHTAVARMVIVGKPDLTEPPPPPTTTIMQGNPASITVVLASPCEGHCNHRGSGSGSLQFEPASSIRDTAMQPNESVGQYITEPTFRLF